jgi:hypothetical protein
MWKEDEMAQSFGRQKDLLAVVTCR